MKRMLTDAEYLQLVQKLSATEEGKGITPNMNAVNQLRQVHRLLAIDGRKPEELTPTEQIYAKAFGGAPLAVVEEINQDGTPTGNMLAAVDIPDAPAKPAAAKAPTKAELKEK